MGGTKTVLLGVLFASAASFRPQAAFEPKVKALRVELAEVAGSPARARVVQGK